MTELLVDLQVATDTKDKVLVLVVLNKILAYAIEEVDGNLVQKTLHMIHTIEGGN